MSEKPTVLTPEGDIELEQAAEELDAASSLLPARDILPETLLVISTDLSHFHSYSEARQLDRQTCQRLLSRDSGLSGQEACGAYALNGLMSSARARELEIELLALCNSGDTGAGRDRVVGYAAFTMH